MSKQHSIFRKARILVFLFGFTIILIVSACGSQSFNTFIPPDDSASLKNCRIVQHSMGETCVPISPQRIVVLDSVMLEDVLALEQKPLGGNLRYVSPVVQVRARGTVDIGFEGGINLERVLRLKPDLILGLKNSPQIYSQLSQIAPTVFVQFNHSGEWKKVFASVGEVLGKTEQVKQVMADYFQRAKTFRMQVGADVSSSAKNPPSSTQVSVVRLYPEMITLYTKSGFIGTILEDADLPRPPSQDLDLIQTQALAGDPIQYSISKEVMDMADGEAVFVIVGKWNSKIGEVLSALKDNPLWLRLKAVQQKRIYEVGDHWVGGGPIAAKAVIDDLYKYLVNAPQ
ncbi:ABC transporter substrate-binding protein [Phormidesmis sp. 146-35]